MLHAVSISGHEDLRFAGKIDEAKKSEEDGRTTEDRRREKKDTAWSQEQQSAAINLRLLTNRDQ